ncbi:uncharacterized protein BDZ99DRAFT_459973 [Mytilinidion resinicola]|uniref:RING-type domain-containing protein n=1 Tax=Mytilinidion resinicola TaxID=574789 RepID=A0A6A6Z0M1_9PEZI|nr:uncharacterized protein BDZ99DRAFT_459973 [Mytilinidion resinicola]KAF2814269.1 hypothetical protein BDZ99DRAFT_459973 [Mytilinidion resinicola]
MRYDPTDAEDIGDAIDMLAPHIHNRLAFCNESDLETYRQICDLEERVEQLCATLDDREDVYEAIKSSNILSSMYEAGQKVRKQLNEGVEMLLGCHEAYDTYLPTGDPIPLSSVSTPYDGPAQDCSICFDSIGRHNGRVIGCNHAFHQDCLQALIDNVTESSNKCPQCRHIICERRARVPGPDEHHFNQRLALEAMHTIYYARLDLTTLRSLYNSIFAEAPPWDWLIPDDAWEDWPHGELDSDDEGGEQGDDEGSDEDDEGDQDDDDDETSSTGSRGTFSDSDVEMEDAF